MKPLSLFAFLLGTTFPIASIASDGYLGWTSLTFEDGAGWRVHVAESDERIAKGFTRITALEISRHGTVVDIPASATAAIQDPLLNDVKLLTVWPENKVVLQIPVFPTVQLRESCKMRVWEISIVDGEFAGSRATEVQKESVECS